MKTLRLLTLLITAFLVAASSAESDYSKPIAPSNVAPDPIDQLVAKLTTQPLWNNGEYIPVKLPESATAEQVLQQVFQNLLVANTKVLEVRQVKITPDVTRAYSAALYQTGAVRKIVLCQFQNGGWWNRIYEADLGPPGAHAALQPVQPTLQPGDVPVGSLGFAIGNYLTIEGVREDGLLTSGVKTLRVETVNGIKLTAPVSIWIENIDALPKDGRCVLKGYENFQMIGQPPAYAAAAKEAGREAPPQPQAGWQVSYHFVVLSVVSPGDVKIKQATAEQAAPVGTDVAKLLAELPSQQSLRAAKDAVAATFAGTPPSGTAGKSAEEISAANSLIEKTKEIIPKVRSLIVVGSSVFDYPGLLAHGDMVGGHARV